MKEKFKISALTPAVLADLIHDATYKADTVTPDDSQEVNADGKRELPDCHGITGLL